MFLKLLSCHYLLCLSYFPEATQEGTDLPGLWVDCLSWEHPWATLEPHTWTMWPNTEQSALISLYSILLKVTV